MKQAAIYGRVSSRKQEEEKTIQSQLTELEEVYTKDEVQIVKQYLDDGWLGTTLERPALDEL